MTTTRIALHNAVWRRRISSPWRAVAATRSLAVVSGCDNWGTRCSSRSFSATANDNNHNNHNHNTSPPTSTTNPYLSGDSTHFGFADVPIGEKEGRVRQVFDKVADSYDLMNDLMSGGLHRVWKDYLLDISNVATMARVVRADSTGTTGTTLKILDVAGGTGDVAFRFVEAAASVERAKSSGVDPVTVTVCDLNGEMLRVGQARARQQFGHALLDDSQGLSFVQGNAQDLHAFPDDTFDLYTIAFGLRNVTDVDRALREARRVLKPGGRFICLEFSHVTLPILAQLYDAYSFQVIPALGEWAVGDRASYQYLVESIRKFPNQPELQARMQKAGFQGAQWTNLTAGVVAIHQGWKAV